MDSHLIPLRDGWALWRDIALRSAGFPVSGLDVFGPGDESARIHKLATDPRFREAVTWQNRSAVHNALDRLQAQPTEAASKYRRREDVVASYWQRYCAKNDTIGFFGPLAWGSFVDDGPAISMRVGRSDATRSVHFEAWCFEVLVDVLGAAVRVPLGPYPERDVRAQLERSNDAALRERGLAALDRLERARDVIARATPEELDEALGALDRVFEELTGAAATRRGGVMYGARTLVYLDCMRDLDLAVGPAVQQELAITLPALLAASRWYCGRVFQVLSPIVDGIVREMGNGPLAPVLGRSLGAMFAGPPQVGEVNAELQQRWRSLLTDPDVRTLAARAADAFADYGPAWPLSVYHSPDVQIAARDAAAIEAGDFLCVVGDFHPGANTMSQGLFAQRHPDRAQFLNIIAAESGEGLYLIPPKSAERMTSRIMPAMTHPDRVHVAATDDADMPEGHRVVSAADLMIEDGVVVSADGSVRGDLIDLMQGPMFVAGIRNYNPFPSDEHATRLTLSRTVLRRETWNFAASAMPSSSGDLGAWAAGAGMPRRVFILSPFEAKPVFVDLESDALKRVASRLIRRAASENPATMLRFTEMLPPPEECWLQDDEGERYTSELRLVAVDLERARSH